MKEKIKVSKKLSEAIELISARGINNALIKHAMCFNSKGTLSDRWKSDPYTALNEIDLKTLAEILLSGYIIEETLEGKLINAIKSTHVPSGYCNDFNNGVSFALKIIQEERKNEVD